MTRLRLAAGGGGSPGWEPPPFERVLAIMIALAAIVAVLILLRGPA